MSKQERAATCLINLPIDLLREAVFQIFQNRCFDKSWILSVRTRKNWAAGRVRSKLKSFLTTFCISFSRKKDADIIHWQLATKPLLPWNRKKDDTWKNSKERTAM